MNNQVYHLERGIFYFDLLDNNEMAILLYKQGIRELEKAVNLNVDPNGTMFILIVFSICTLLIDKRATELHAKLCKNLAMARERVHALRKLIIFFLYNFYLFFL